MPSSPSSNAAPLPPPAGAERALPTGRARKAVDTLGRWIVNGRFPPETVMPTEPELAEELGTSRATVRDAVKVLSGKGLLRTARRYGTRVMPVDDWNLLDAEVVGWHDRDHPRMARIFAETTELRAIVEPEAAALAAVRATGCERALILEAAQTMHPKADDRATLFAADCQFHITILEATQNRVMRQMRPIILAILRVSYEFGVRPENVPVTRAGHIRVAEAIARADADAAREAMRTMLRRNAAIAGGHHDGGRAP